MVRPHHLLIHRARGLLFCCFDYEDKSNMQLRSLKGISSVWENLSLMALSTSPGLGPQHRGGDGPRNCLLSVSRQGPPCWGSQDLGSPLQVLAEDETLPYTAEAKSQKRQGLRAPSINCVRIQHNISSSISRHRAPHLVKCIAVDGTVR